METQIKKLYEAMFLVDSAQAQSDWDGVNTIIKSILERAEAEIVSIKKWDERRLAYEIDRHSRGTYILCYFKAEGKRIWEIERDVRLSERIMRVLILCADHIREEDVERAPILQKDSKMGTQKDTPVMRVEKHKPKAALGVAEKVEAEQVSAQEAVEDVEELERSASDVSEREQPGQAETEKDEAKVKRQKTRVKRKFKSVDEVEADRGV